MPEAIHGSPQKSIDKNKNKNPKESGEDEQQIKHIIRRCPTGVLEQHVRSSTMEAGEKRKAKTRDGFTCILFDGSTPLLASYSQGNRKTIASPLICTSNTRIDAYIGPPSQSQP
ncbi:predicted protein [Histoplasma capsulatum G186AR]|uniref:Uncharacterized protein n=1 Tax=Ajellomyces capsulatus (strain G186AR / H82 / ATCC MYA-2454 / RMSCC 2432) TaxID=447093 RepID=C0NF80_AJECG|nr:uncharacterized protein HCBG_01546 [Histoplasma capsulatum G186AR]EEH09901.1 predicted protein [Histoplasma capsulatum G186AR]